MKNYNHGTIKHFGIKFISDMGIELPEELMEQRTKTITYKAEIDQVADILINDKKVDSRDFFGVKSESWNKLIAALNYEKFLSEMPLTSIIVYMVEDAAAEIEINTLMIGVE